MTIYEYLTHYYLLRVSKRKGKTHLFISVECMKNVTHRKF